MTERRLEEIQSRLRFAQGEPVIRSSCYSEDVAELLEELARLQEALQKYGTHDPRCPQRNWEEKLKGTPCNCGLDAARGENGAGG